MKVDQLNGVYYNLLEDCREYYDNFTSQQGDEDMVLGDGDGLLLDFMIPETNEIHKGAVISLTKKGLSMYDFTTKKGIIVDFDWLFLSDQLEVLSIYEQVLHNSK